DTGMIRNPLIVCSTGPRHCCRRVMLWKSAWPGCLVARGQGRYTRPSIKRHAGERGHRPTAEGAIRPETLRQQDRMTQGRQGFVVDSGEQPPSMRARWLTDGA